MQIPSMDWETGRRYRISYESGSGQASKRIIDLIRVSASPDGCVFLRAFCHLRGEERTFRADRVLHAALVAAPAPEPRATPAARPIARPEFRRPAPAQMPAPAAREPMPSAPAPARQRRSFGDLVGTAFAFMMAFSFLVACLGNLGFFKYLAANSSYSSLSNYATLPRPVPAPRPSPPPLPAVEDATIAGLTLRTLRAGGRESYEVPALGLKTEDKAEAIAAIRQPFFIEATGIADPALAAAYLRADLNQSGRLSFEELSAFQKKTYRDFRYEANETALRPDEFLAAGGGDCDDFALFTAGLLRFWGWEPYLGCLGPSRGGTGHAVCLSYEEGSISPSFTYFTLSDWRTEDGTEAKAGKYIPIDYDQVGALSNAAEKGWKLRYLYLPEKAWGLRM